MSSSFLAFIRSFSLAAGSALFGMHACAQSAMQAAQSTATQSKSQKASFDMRNLLLNIQKLKDLQAPAAEQSAEVTRTESERPFQQDQGATAEARAKSICHERRKYIFVSRSLGKSALKEIFEEAAANPDVTVLFQGVPKGQTINKGIVDVQKLAVTIDPEPSVGLNPLIFQRQNVDVVPTVMILSPGKWSGMKCQQEVLIRAEGISSIEYLERKLNLGEKGDLGTLGPVRSISEPNLMDVIKSRIKGINWKKKEQYAVNHAWDNLKNYDLPPATQNRVYRIDPTVTAKEDIRGADGRLLVHKGQKVNPLDIRPFDEILVVFNPLRRNEVLFTKRMVKQAQNEDIKIIPVLSQIDKAEGWNMYNRVQHEIHHRVFMLMPDLKQEFHITHTLSVVRASGRYFQLREVKVGSQ